MSVYFIQAEGTDEVKIGHGNVGFRLKSLQTGNAKRLKIIRTAEGGRTIERWLHRFYERVKIHPNIPDNEWFHFREDMMTLDIPTPEMLSGHHIVSINGQKISLALRLEPWGKLNPGDSTLIAGHPMDEVRRAVRDFRRRGNREFSQCGIYKSLEFKIGLDPEGVRVERLADREWGQ